MKLVLLARVLTSPHLQMVGANLGTRPRILLCLRALPVRTAPVPATRPIKSRSRRIEYAGLAITVGSILLVMFLLYLYVFSALTGARSQNRLLHSLSSNPKAVFGLVTGHQAHNGQAIAILDIPSLGLHQAVVEGTTAADLQLGPGLVSGSTLPGELGNAVIAGRRVSFGGPFRGIGGLKQGDEIKVADGAGDFVFTVTSVETVSTVADFCSSIRP